ncbi:MAG: sulfatase-like hydrolase/transferase, partial [Bdellovibrionales bacterium]
MNRRLLLAGLIAITLGGVAISARVIYKKITAKSRLNVLVVSACSLRWDRLGVFNPQSRLTPKIDAWAKGAFVFNNAIAERPWQNYTYESSDTVRRDFLHENGYKDYLDRQFGYNFSIPPTERIQREGGGWYWPESAILNYRPGIENLKRELLQNLNVPFYVFAHLKYMHYPYLDSQNMNAADWKKLTPRSQELLAKYLAHPDKYDAQLPLIELITNSFKLLKTKFGLKEDIFSVAGIVSDPVRNLRWRKSPGFKDDIALAQELYDLKMKPFDDQANEILNLFGNRELQERTVVIFTGDHGEAFSEHGVIGHSVNVYDEMLRFPLIIKFPGSAATEVIDTQLTHLQLAKLAAGIVKGEINAGNFAQSARQLAPETVLSRNCGDTIRSARYRSEWKFIKNLDSEQNELYNLKTDPGETKNLVSENPEMAWKLEEYMNDHLADLQRQNSKGS